MSLSSSFKFADNDLNKRFIGLLKKKHIQHALDANNVVYYSPKDEEVVENDLLQSIRTEVFDPWQVLTCPPDWVERYRAYMNAHDIPFQEEWANNQLWFLLPSKYRPHSWKLRRDNGSNGSTS
jgi:hypothetical protein